MFRRVATFLFLMLGPAAQAAPALDWRVEHPFRYFTETKDFDMHREASAELMLVNGGTLSATAVSDLERLVNDPRWLREWYKQDANLYSDPRRAGRPERGWAHHINRRRATCWDSRQQWHSSCASDSFGRALRTDYVRPPTHGVAFSIGEAPEGTCRWEAARAIFIVGRGSLAPHLEASCRDDVKTRIPFEPDVPEADRGVNVSVTLPDGTKLMEPSVWVRDRLIVGVGDSFSSGEGNPDSPVEIDPFSHRRNLNISFVYDPASQALRSNKAFSLPVRAQNAPAGWLDRKCHRSAYSYHLRTALQLALTDPKHSAVTFLGFACSGAEITEGLLLPYAGVEEVDTSYFRGGGLRRRNMPQVDRVVTELCRDDLTEHPLRRNIRLAQPITDPQGHKLSSVSLLNCPAGRFLRQIDLLIISIGGNDVGFTPLIVDVLTKRRPPYADFNTELRARGLLADVVRGVARVMKAHDVARAEERARELPARFAALRRAIEPIPIRTNADGEPNIILTAFPKVEFNEEGRLCGEADPRERLEGFNVGGVLAIDVPTLRPVSTFANNTLFTATQDAAKLGRWHFVDAHRSAFSKHGICAQKRLGTDVSAAENLMLPYYHSVKNQRDRWSDFEPFSANREDDFKPLRDTRAYAPRERWFRTLNDICLFVQFRAKGTPPPPEKWGLIDLVEACLGGPFHPTAEGHAHIADAVYNQVKTMLDLPPADASDIRPR